MTGCVIIHNMIVEEEGHGVRHDLNFQNVGDHIQLREQNLMTFENFIQMHRHIRMSICGASRGKLKNISE